MADSLSDVTRLIQLAVAPIFLLMAVASTLTVFTSRLARIVDRGRALEKDPARAPELRTIERRAQLIYRAMTFGVVAAICISLLMSVLFAGALLHFGTTKIVAALFMLSLFAYTGALILLLNEVFLALSSFGLGLKISGEATR